MWFTLSSQPHAQQKARDVLTACLAGEELFKCPGGFKGCCTSSPCGSKICIRSNGATDKKTTTIAAVAPPVLASPTPIIPAKTLPEKQVGVTTYFNIQPTTGGGYFSDSLTLPSPTIFSPSPSITATQASVPVISATAPATKESDSQLSAAAKGGIIAGAAAIVLIVIALYFMCGKQRRKLRTQNSIDSLDKPGIEGGGATEEDGHTKLASPSQPDGAHQRDADETSDATRPEDVFASFGGRYEEPQSRFNRVSDMSSNSRMMNHPVSPMSRETASLPGPAPPASTVVARSVTASPEFVSRLGTATPELQGPPQQAAIAELASPGLPKVVEIHSRRSGVQKYKPYRPNATNLYPVAETTPNHLTGTLNATKEERSRKAYVNSWKEWESTA
ncbi:hypothetical protein CKAH01_12508 [Colletotrichum kahawae]|uniref:Uncharacterized protein n=1 Tax=Colletotrichum kahawae TaxID=34407 RepID=A0AAD9YV68_COLKA|nr:hypothetical protein CKAH01_12508 [Colletotrichum kahawae]